MRSYIKINLAQKEWKVKYKELLHNEDNYRYMLRQLRDAPLSNEVIGKRRALNELIEEEHKPL